MSNMEEKDLWQQIVQGTWTLRSRVQGKLKKISEIYNLERPPSCEVSVIRNPDGKLTMVLKIPEGEKIALMHWERTMSGHPREVADRILPLLSILAH